MSEHDSTLIRRGSKATTFRDMAEFVEAIAERPLDKLIAEMPELAKLSETKFRLAAHAIRRRSAELTPVEREQLRIFTDEISAAVDPAIGLKIQSIFQPLRDREASRERERPNR